MCGRYLIKRKTLKKISDILEIPLFEDFDDEGEETINPGGRSIVISSGPGFAAFDWGYTNPYDKRLIINARSETVSEKAMFRNDFRYNRCLVPADTYYEWTADKKKAGFFLNDRSFFMAAICRTDSDQRQMVILTKDAAEDIKHIHPRSPVIIPFRNLNDWLNNYDSALSIMKMQNPKFNYQLETN